MEIFTKWTKITEIQWGPGGYHDIIFIEYYIIIIIIINLLLLLLSLLLLLLLLLSKIRHNKQILPIKLHLFVPMLNI